MRTRAIADPFDRSVATVVPPDATSWTPPDSAVPPVNAAAAECDPADDERQHETQHRVKREIKFARLRRALDNPKRARAVYRDFALLDAKLPHGEFRVLCYHLTKADADLSNCFVSDDAAAKALRMKRENYRRCIKGLRAKGYERVQEFRGDAGKQARGSGVQFCLPGQLFPLGESWRGPARWDNRESGVPKRPRRNAKWAVAPADGRQA